MMVTFWASTEVIHLSIAGARVKSVRSHLSAADLARLAASGGRPAGPPPIPAAEPGAAIEADRAVSKDGHVSLGGRSCIAAEILGGTMVSIRIEQNTLMFFDPATRVLLRTRPSPLTWDQARLLRGARPAGPPPRRLPNRSPSKESPATPASSWSPGRRSPSAVSTPARSSPSTSPRTR
jgi:hypothetical protein